MAADRPAEAGSSGQLVQQSRFDGKIIAPAGVLGDVDGLADPRGTSVQQQHPVGKLQGFLAVVRDQQRRHRPLPQHRDQVPALGPRGFPVQRGEGLVQQQQVRLAGERARERHPALLAAGKLAGALAGLVREADGRKRRFNTSILVDRAGAIVGKYRKVHLPGHATYEPQRPWQHLEKGYFEPGDLGFPTWRTMDAVMGMCLCNDRRWPETWRCLGLRGVELVMLGYNTPVGNSVAAESPHLRMFHSHMSMQAGAYQNGTWVVGTAKAGLEEGVDMMAGSCIVAPTGEIVALATTNGDEVIVHRADMERGRYIRDTIFNFADHRRIEHYGIIAGQTAPVAPE